MYNVSQPVATSPDRILYTYIHYCGTHFVFLTSLHLVYAFLKKIQYSSTFNFKPLQDLYPVGWAYLFLEAY